MSTHRPLLVAGIVVISAALIAAVALPTYLRGTNQDFLGVWQSSQSAAKIALQGSEGDYSGFMIASKGAVDHKYALLDLRLQYPEISFRYHESDNGRTWSVAGNISSGLDTLDLDVTPEPAGRFSSTSIQFVRGT